MNEGFTVFNENKVVGRLYGKKLQHLHGCLLIISLAKAIQSFGDNPNATKLSPKLEGIDPDDVFSAVPYNKGCFFLMHLEEQAGGPEIFEPFQRKWIETNALKNVTPTDFRQFYEQHFPQTVGKIDWNIWLNHPGGAPLVPKFDDSLGRAYEELAQRWIEDQGENATSDDVAGFVSRQKEGFLSTLNLKKIAFPTSAIEKMRQVYHFDASKNTDILLAWYILCLNSNYEPAIAGAVKLVSNVGRMKYIRPLYKALFDSSLAKPIAISTFKANKQSYHSIAARQLEQDLHLV